MTPIPAFDLNKLEQGLQLNELHLALKDVGKKSDSPGFIYLSNHGIPHELIETSFKNVPENLTSRSSSLVIR
jgi:isopenicillin N synthase-like dioxygenase